MSEQEKSGSRWEPGDDAAGSPDDAGPGAANSTANGRRTWRDRLRTRGALIGAGVALVALVGGGGFALGHAVAGDGHDRDQWRYGPGFDGERDGDRGGRGLPPGMNPGQPMLPPNQNTPQDDSTTGGSDDGTGDAS